MVLYCFRDILFTEKVVIWNLCHRSPMEAFFLLEIHTIAKNCVRREFIVIVIIITWLIFCVVVGAVAQSIGRSFGGYFAISLCLSPLIGFIILAIKGKASEEEMLREKRHIFYCPACGSTYSSQGKQIEHCDKCGDVLMETTVLFSDWTTYDDEKKENLKKAFSKGQYSIKSVSVPVKQVVVQQNNAADELKKFKELLDMGAITQEEYDAKKKQILDL